MRRYSFRFHRNEFEYLGNWPDEADTPWSENAQGIAHDDQYWFLSNDKELFRYPVGRLTGSPDLRVDLSLLLRRRGFSKFKALTVHGDAVLVPLGGERAGIARYRAWDLQYLAYTELPDEIGAMAWVAVNPRDGLLYGPERGDAGTVALHAWHLDLSGNELALEYARRVPLRGGYPLADQQGGTFSPNGQLYIVNGYYDRVGDQSAGAYVYRLMGEHGHVRYADQSRQGITVWSVGDRRLVGASSQRGDFRYQWDPNWLVVEEPEGVTFWDLDGDGGRPRGPGGQLHAILLDNDSGVGPQDDVYVKHYRISDPIPIHDLFVLHRHVFDHPERWPSALGRIHGISHDERAWYLATTDGLWRISRDHDPGLDPTDAAGTVFAPWPDTLGSDVGGGDVAVVDGTLLVPVRATGRAPRLTAFRCDDLALLGHAGLDQPDAAWCAVRPTDEAVVYVGTSDGVVHTYGLDLDGGVEMTTSEPLALTVDGRPARLAGVTGGAVSSVSHLFYLSHRDGVSVFHSDGRLVDATGLADTGEPSFVPPGAARFGAVTTDAGAVGVADVPGDVDLHDVHIVLDRADGQSLSMWRLDQPEAVGNRRSRELHRPGCPAERRMSPANRVPFDRVGDGFRAGMDGCWFCLRPEHTS